MRDHVYVTPKPGERCRSRDHEDHFPSSQFGLCSGCGRCLWDALPERCPGGLRTEVAA